MRRKISNRLLTLFDRKECRRTCSRRVLPEVFGLIPSEEAFGLCFRSRSSRKLLVKAHNSLHASSIRSGTNTLNSVSVVLPPHMRIGRLFRFPDGSERRNGLMDWTGISNLQMARQPDTS